MKTGVRRIERGERPVSYRQLRVGVKQMKTIRRAIALDEANGCDSSSFYDRADMIDVFVNEYRTILSKLARQLTVLAIAVIENEHRGCCDIRAGLWNRIQRELAEEQLRIAEDRLAPVVDAEFCVAEGPSVDEALVRVAQRGGYDVLIVPEGQTSRLRRKSRLADRLRARIPCEVITPGRG